MRFPCFASGRAGRRTGKAGEAHLPKPGHPARTAALGGAAMTQVAAFTCPDCKDVVYSRARHDFRGCSCKGIFVDGGFDYVRIGYREKPPEECPLEVDATKAELYQDWDTGANKYGLIKATP